MIQNVQFRQQITFNRDTYHYNPNLTFREYDFDGITWVLLYFKLHHYWPSDRFAWFNFDLIFNIVSDEKQILNYKQLKKLTLNLVSIHSSILFLLFLIFKYNLKFIQVKHKIECNKLKQYDKTIKN